MTILMEHMVSLMGFPWGFYWEIIKAWEFNPGI
jgi:hypothetical protein